MKKITLILMALSTCLLAACDDETTITGLPGPTQPTEPSDTDPDPGPVSLRSVLLNDVTGDTYLNAWECDDPAFPGEVTEMVFFEDNTVLIGDASGQIRLTYAVSNADTVESTIVDLFVEGLFLIQFSNFTLAASQQSYDLFYSAVDGQTGTFSCQLVGDVPETVETFDANSFANYQEVSELDNGWGCLLNEDPDNDLVLFLGADGFGVYGDDDYPDNIFLSWSVDEDELSLSFEDGTQVIASNARANSTNLTADSVLVDGENVGRLLCIRVALDL